MAFGIKRNELNLWKEEVTRGRVAFLTHYWLHPRYPEVKTVTKVGCSDLERLAVWGAKYGLKKEYIHARFEFPHYDLFGDLQREILHKEHLVSHLQRFGMESH